MTVGELIIELKNYGDDMDVKIQLDLEQIATEIGIVFVDNSNKDEFVNLTGSVQNTHWWE